MILLIFTMALGVSTMEERPAPPLSVSSSERSVYDDGFEKECMQVIAKFPSSEKYMIGKRRITKSDKYGLVFRADFGQGWALDDTVNRIICWRPEEGGEILIAFSFGQREAPL